MIKEFITFGGGAKNFHEAGERLKNQALNLELFDKVTLYTEEDLKKDTEFWNKHGEFIENNKRGYGYWIWKSYLIKKKFDSMNDGDVLMYLDCGCEIHINRRGIINYYFDLVKTRYIITTIIDKEKLWNKMDVILRLGMLDDKVMNSGQKEAGMLLFFVCEKTRKIVNDWYELCSDYRNIDDSPSMVCNDNEYKEHRHDQSVLSLLLKKNEIVTDILMHDCVYYIRNTTGVSRLSL